MTHKNKGKNSKNNILHVYTREAVSAILKALTLVINAQSYNWRNIEKASPYLLRNLTKITLGYMDRLDNGSFSCVTSMVLAVFPTTLYNVPICLYKWNDMTVIFIAWNNSWDFFPVLISFFVVLLLLQTLVFPLIMCDMILLKCPNVGLCVYSITICMKFRLSLHEDVKKSNRQTNKQAPGKQSPPWRR